MPRLNHGTLLENLVLVEVVRAVLDDVPAGRSTSAPSAQTSYVELASAFAMPPLTSWWHKRTKAQSRAQTEEAQNPRLNAQRAAELWNLAAAPAAAGELGACLHACVHNDAGLPVHAYAGDDALEILKWPGGNGVLLACMVARRRGRVLRTWSNDLPEGQGRYRAPAAGALLTSDACARALLGHPDDGRGDDTCSTTPFPGSRLELEAWTRPCAARIGFLDPDNYAVDERAHAADVTSVQHVAWLEGLRQRAGLAVGALFFANNDTPSREAAIARFHQDAAATWPHSVVWVHGRFCVGVKATPSGAALLASLRAGVQRSWAAWARHTEQGTGALTEVLG